jgi:hypothetical protein
MGWSTWAWAKRWPIGVKKPFKVAPHGLKPPPCRILPERLSCLNLTVPPRAPARIPCFQVKFGRNSLPGGGNHFHALVYCCRLPVCRLVTTGGCGTDVSDFSFCPPVNQFDASVYRRFGAICRRWASIYFCPLIQIANLGVFLNLDS